MLAYQEALARRIARDVPRHILARRPDIATLHPGWRARQMRALSLIPPGGASLTELAALLGMAKQSAAETVAALVEVGLVASEADPDDRRAVVLRPTPLGRQLALDVHAAILAVQDEWAAEVGPRRLATFLAVMDELGLAVEDGG
ncbi:MAG TPA: MarR family transcriptional regulator [Iamia sp.]|nr:MarR family transcriptional regulator [Iamia sp.]